jgi:hypothetical protein
VQHLAGVQRGREIVPGHEVRRRRITELDRVVRHDVAREDAPREGRAIVRQRRGAGGGERHPERNRQHAEPARPARHQHDEQRGRRPDQQQAFVPEGSERGDRERPHRMQLAPRRTQRRPQVEREQSDHGRIDVDVAGGELERPERRRGEEPDGDRLAARRRQRARGERERGERERGERHDTERLVDVIDDDGDGRRDVLRHRDVNERADDAVQRPQGQVPARDAEGVVVHGGDEESLVRVEVLRLDESTSFGKRQRRPDQTEAPHDDAEREDHPDERRRRERALRRVPSRRAAESHHDERQGDHERDRERAQHGRPSEVGVAPRDGQRRLEQMQPEVPGEAARDQRRGEHRACARLRHRSRRLPGPVR